MGPRRVVVSTPSLAFSTRFVEAHEPVGVDTFGAEFAVQAFDKRVVCRLAGPTEVERHIMHESPEIEFPADELGAVVETNGLRIAQFACGLLERGDDISAAIG